MRIAITVIKTFLISLSMVKIIPEDLGLSGGKLKNFVQKLEKCDITIINRGEN